MENTVQDLVNEYHDRSRTIIHESPQTKWAIGASLYITGYDPYRTDFSGFFDNLIVTNYYSFPKDDK